MALAILVAGVPILGTVFVANSTTEADLSELTAINQQVANYFILDWPSLLQDSGDRPNAGTVIPEGLAVQVLGYMMDDGQPIHKGTWVQDFLLMPDVGNLLHPSHRFRDQMISVHLSSTTRIQFSPRALVWAQGNLRGSGWLGARSEPLYTLDNANVEFAERENIRRYFR